MPIHQEKQACLHEMRASIAKNVFKAKMYVQCQFGNFRIQKPKETETGVYQRATQWGKKKYMKHAKLNHRINVPMSSVNKKKNQFHITVKRWTKNRFTTRNPFTLLDLIEFADNEQICFFLYQPAHCTDKLCTRWNSKNRQSFLIVFGCFLFAFKSANKSRCRLDFISCTEDMGTIVLWILYYCHWKYNDYRYI